MQKSLMKRYVGSWLGDTPHIVVLGSRKLGNFVATLPLLRCIRKKYPNCRLDFWGSRTTKSFEEKLVGNKESNVSLDWRMSWDEGIEAMDIYKYIEERGNPDLIINCDGFNPTTAILAALLNPKWVSGNAMMKDLNSRIETGKHIYNKILDDYEWDSPEFLSKYGGKFKTQYIGEIFCRLAFMEPTMEDLIANDLPSIKPQFDVPKILVHCTSTRSAKLWTKSSWMHVLDWCRHNDLEVGLIGAAPNHQKKDYNSGELEEELLKIYGKNKVTLIDLRGKTDLMELAGACQNTKAVITVDAGPLHVAAAVGTPVMTIVGNDEEGTGASPIRLWLPPKNNVVRTTSKNTCDKCAKNRYKNDNCILEEHYCMDGVNSEQVIKWLEKIIK